MSGKQTRQNKQKVNKTLAKVVMPLSMTVKTFSEQLNERTIFVTSSAKLTC